MNQIQLQIKAQPDDQLFTEQVFVAAARKFALIDTKATSLVDQTICNYSEGLGFGFGIGARRLGDLILIDFNPGRKKSDLFREVFHFIESELRILMADRLSIAEEASHIPIENTLPISEAARAFHKTILESQ